MYRKECIDDHHIVNIWVYVLDVFASLPRIMNDHASNSNIPQINIGDASNQLLSLFSLVSLTLTSSGY